MQAEGGGDTAKPFNMAPICERSGRGAFPTVASMGGVKEEVEYVLLGCRTWDTAVVKDLIRWGALPSLRFAKHAEPPIPTAVDMVQCWFKTSEGPLVEVELTHSLFLHTYPDFQLQPRTPA